AADSEVPLGNVYYYFKTKEDLVRAVIDDRAAGLSAMMAGFEQRRTPAARLKALPRHWAEMREVVAQHGCPIGTLCADVDEAATLLHAIVDWAAEQFRSLGRRDAQDLAVTLVAGIQGASVLAQAFHDPELLATQARGLERWIDSLG
ncbi:MAG TPA: TetR/AcrR family transcriptional regulator, partial [Acidimicrobiia bacterium]|nr:TetR/AcrR family transcriptional regulator [Acidimicrobiia bacterium]